MNPLQPLITIEKAREILGNQYNSVTDDRLREYLTLLTLVINKVVDSHF